MKIFLCYWFCNLWEQDKVLLKGVRFLRVLGGFVGRGGGGGGLGSQQS